MEKGKTKYVIESENIYDELKQVRYKMVRTWDPDKPSIAIIMFNPARLDPHPIAPGRTLGAVINAVLNEHEDDFGSLQVVNLVPHLAATKNQLSVKQKTFDRENFKYIESAVEDSELVVLFWGNDGKNISRHQDFLSLMQRNEQKLRCFSFTTDNEPNYVYSLSEDSTLLKVRATTSGYLRE